GQHRVEGAKLAGVPEVPCIIVAGMSLAEQAAAFVGANRDRVTVNPYALHHARVAAGEERSMYVARVARSAGIDIPRYPIPAQSMKPGQTMALGAIQTLIGQRGERQAKLVLRDLAEAFAEQPGR